MQFQLHWAKMLFPCKPGLLIMEYFVPTKKQKKMQKVFAFSVVTYQAATSYHKENINKTGDLGAESEQKAALAMLGFALGKCFFAYIYSKLAPKLGNVSIHINGGACFVAILVNLIVCTVSYVFLSF